MGVDLGLGIGVISALFAVVITLSRWSNFFKTSFNPFNEQTNNIQSVIWDLVTESMSQLIVQSECTSFITIVCLWASVVITWEANLSTWFTLCKSWEEFFSPFTGLALLQKRRRRNLGPLPYIWHWIFILKLSSIFCSQVKILRSWTSKGDRVVPWCKRMSSGMFLRTIAGILCALDLRRPRTD